MNQDPSIRSELETIGIPARRLKEFAVEILQEADVPAEGAEITADCLIEADLRGSILMGS